MGISFSNKGEQVRNKTIQMAQETDESQKIIERLNFIFPDSEESDNGLCFNEIYLPEELSLVCKNWYNLLKTHSLWSTIYARKYKRIPKPLPWYTFYALFGTNYFDGNLLKNNCGQEKFNHWVIRRNGGNKFKVEKTPIGCDPYAADCPDFKKAKSCFVTSYGICQKVQIIKISRNLIKYILNEHKPHIYASEWVAGRFDCGGCYILKVKAYTKSDIKLNDEYEEMSDDNEGSEDEEDYSYFKPKQFGKQGVIMEEFKYLGNEATQWRKIELVLKDYPEGVDEILFDHQGCDNQFWQGHYGAKMAGGVVRLLFDSMEPKSDVTYDESDGEIN